VSVAIQKAEVSSCKSRYGKMNHSVRMRYYTRQENDDYYKVIPARPPYMDTGSSFFSFDMVDFLSASARVLFARSFNCRASSSVRTFAASFIIRFSCAFLTLSSKNSILLGLSGGGDMGDMGDMGDTGDLGDRGSGDRESALRNSPREKKLPPVGACAVTVATVSASDGVGEFRFRASAAVAVRVLSFAPVDEIDERRDLCMGVDHGTAGPSSYATDAGRP